MRAPRLGTRWVVSLAGAPVLALMGFGVGRLAGTFRPPAAPAVPAAQTGPAASARPAAAAPDAPSSEGAQDRVESVILAQRKRIMGRLRSLEMVSRTATKIRPLVDRALNHPSVQADLRALAAAAGMPVDEYRRYFAAKQEADLLLESGGDPNARSVADACGVAQFLAGTGRSCGLKVNLGQSNAISREMRTLERKLAWLEEQSPQWTQAVPRGLRNVIPTVEPAPTASADASVLPAAAASAPDGHWTRDQWIAYRTKQWRALETKRRAVDHRFDPEKAIMAQTKYLLRLTRRYGGIDWALQAYHGGEGGASRTMRLFAEGSGARTVLASRSGHQRWLPYAELYRRVSPSATPAAFGYLFGRSDDHRYYWWKVLMAERALDLYRKDPKEFERQWQELKPGYRAEYALYPEPEPLQFKSSEALRSAFHDGTLVPLPGNAAALGVRTANVAALAPELAGLHKGLRPEAMGALLRLARIYRSAGGGEPLTVLSMAQSLEYRKRWDARYPRPPVPKGVPSDDPDFHATGLAFDLKRPTRDWDRKVLEYALGQLSDTLRITWLKETQGGSRYHVTVGPKFKDELAAFYRQTAR